MAATRSLAAARRTGNRRTIFAVALVGCGMLGLSFAAVPLYDLFLSLIHISEPTRPY